MVHLRATERLETYGQSPLQQKLKSANALKNIQIALMPALRPLLNTWARDLSLLTSRQIAKQISNHCNQQLIRESVCQIMRKWADDGASPFPIALGPVDPILLFNLFPTKGATQECEDLTSHRLLLGTMAFTLYCDHTIPLNNVCDIVLQLIETPIYDPRHQYPPGLGGGAAWNLSICRSLPLLGRQLFLCHSTNKGNPPFSQEIPGPNVLQTTGQEPRPGHSSRTISNRRHLLCTTHGIPTLPKPHGRRTRHSQGLLHHPRRPNDHG